MVIRPASLAAFTALSLLTACGMMEPERPRGTPDAGDATRSLDRATGTNTTGGSSLNSDDLSSGPAASTGATGADIGHAVSGNVK